MIVTKARHAWPEKKGFKLIRRHNDGEWIFIHFWQPVKLNIDGQEIETQPNAIVILDKDSYNCIECTKHDLIHDFLHIKGDDFVNFLTKYNLKPNEVYYPSNCGFVSDFVWKIEGERFEEEKYKDDVINGHLNVLFALISRYIDKPTDGLSVDYKTEIELKNLRTMIFSNLERDWSISNMAQAISMSESRFYVLYKSVFKTTPNQDLILARMDYAKRLLAQNRTIAISDVAQKCGYANEFHFIRTFKKNSGLTPKKYALMRWKDYK